MQGAADLGLLLADQGRNHAHHLLSRSSGAGGRSQLRCSCLGVPRQDEGEGRDEGWEVKEEGS